MTHLEKYIQDQIHAATASLLSEAWELQERAHALHQQAAAEAAAIRAEALNAVRGTQSLWKIKISGVVLTGATSGYDFRKEVVVMASTREAALAAPLSLPRGLMSPQKTATLIEAEASASA